MKRFYSNDKKYLFEEYMVIVSIIYVCTWGALVDLLRCSFFFR